MKRFPGLLLVVLCLLVASPSFARVISYSAYTTKVALPSVQDRTSRHFVLIETNAEDFFSSYTPRDVVLYDSTGSEEPRVISPLTGGTWQQAALFEKAGGTPVILLVRYGAVMMSEGGAHWRQIQGIGSVYPTQPRDVDTGGPFSGGLFAPIVLGNDAWPFVVTIDYSGVWAISRDGVAVPLSRTSGARVIGRNAAGNRFLIQSGLTVSMVTVDGTVVKTIDLTANGAYAGWITSNGTVYLERLFTSGRTLYVTNGSSLQLIADGPAVYADQDDPLPLRTFAVPTHDYEGAWIVQRAPDQPTRLSRHTPSAGMQLMWSDDTQPEVEALITGKSGQTVLIQVHRSRESAELRKPTIDPALAVWRIAQPAPADYDELYLNEQWNKGFVVVDADRIEDDAFVFDSGYKGLPAPVSRVSAPIGGGGDVIQEWGVVRGSFKQRLVLPGVAHLHGAYDSYWQTDVTLYNPVGQTQVVDVRYVPLGMENTVSATLALEPYEIRTLADVLYSLFGLQSGGGALHLMPQIGINAVARTYSHKGYYYYGYGGTYGFGMNAIDFSNAAGPRFPLTFAGAFPDANFRTNVILTDTSGRGTHANFRTINAWVPDAVIGNVATPVAGTMQATVAAPARTNQDDGVALIVEPTRGSAIATVVAIDNRSQDPTWFPPDVPGTVPRAIPVIGHVSGANGGQFRSDLFLHNPREGSRYVILTARLWNDPNRQYVQWVRLFGHETRVVRDALKTLFGVEGIARLTYSSAESEPGEGVRVTSRTYTVDATGATYGCLVPPLNGFQIAGAGEKLEILGVGGGSGFRTNVGLVDLSNDTWDDPLVRISIIGSKRQVLDTMVTSIPARGGIQLSDIFRARGITPPAAALLVVEVLQGQQIAAYATLVDNVTNDATYLSSQLAAKE